MINGDARRMVMYPCRDNTELNFVALHPDTESSGTSDDWNAVGSKDALLKVFDQFSDDVKTLLSKAHKDTVKVWKLLDLEAISHVSCCHFPQNFASTDGLLSGQQGTSLC